MPREMRNAASARTSIEKTSLAISTGWNWLVIEIGEAPLKTQSRSREAALTLFTEDQGCPRISSLRQSDKWTALSPITENREVET